MMHGPINLRYGLLFIIFIFILKVYYLYDYTDSVHVKSDFTRSKCFVAVDSLTVFHTECVGIFAVYILKPKAGHYLQALQLHREIVFSFRANSDEINDTACTHHSPSHFFSQPEEEIGQEFDICAQKEQGKSYTENTPYTDSGCGIRINLIMTLEGKFVTVFLCTLILQCNIGGGST